MERVFEFGLFRLDRRERTLLRGGARVDLPPKLFDVLVVLLANSGRLVEKDWLLRSVWSDVHVGEGVLTRAISDLRRALGQTEGRSWIETVPKFGYRFTAPVAVVQDHPAGRGRRGLRVWPLALAAAAALLAVLPGHQALRGFAAHSAPDPEAVHLYAEGRYECGRATREGLEKGAEYLRQAIGRDQGYARAYSGLADCYLLLGVYGYYPPQQMLPAARLAAERALQLEPDLAEAHAALGAVSRDLDWNWKEAERHFRESIRLAPGSAAVHDRYAQFLAVVGRFDEAEREFTRALELDPISPLIQTDQAELYFYERRYGDSLALLSRVASEHPSFTLAYERAALALLAQGREEEAWRAAMSVPDSPSGQVARRLVWTAWLPRRAPQAARSALEELEAGAAAGRVPAYTVMLGHLRQDHIQEALDWLERMGRAREPRLVSLRVDPLLAGLRGMQRARAVLGKLHLE